MPRSIARSDSIERREARAVQIDTDSCRPPSQARRSRGFGRLQAVGTERDERDLDKIAAVVLAVSVGMYLGLGYGVTLGFLAAAATAPIWASAALSDRRFRIVLMLTVLAVASGLVLFGNATERSIADWLSLSVGIVTVPLSAGALIWASRVLSVDRMALAFAVGSMLGIPFSGDDQGNPWRFTYSIPIALLLLAWTGRRTTMILPQILVLLGLAGAGMLNDSRSNTAFLLLAASVILVQHLFGQSKSKKLTRGVGILILIIALAYALYEAVTAAILGGDFGADAQQRTQAQIDSAGSLLLGGRPELAASYALLSEHPLGIGPGVDASWADFQLAKQAMWNIGYDPNNGYVSRYMFGSGIEVHSTLGDLWLRFGIVGAILVLFLAWLNLSALVNGLVQRAVSGLFIYLVIRSIWDLAVSPFASSAELMPLVLALALLMPRLERSRKGCIETGGA